MKSRIELWRTVNGYEGLYQVSNLGRVRSVDHLQKGKLKSAGGYIWKYKD